MANNTNATPSPEELLLKREQEVTAREEAVAAKEKEFEAQAVEIQKKEELYAAYPSELEGLRKEVEELRAELDKVQVAPAKVVPGVEFKFEEQSYKFKDSAPKSIRIDGVVKTQKELAKDKESLLQLIGGNSGLIEKIQ